jgi:hypothetical protein
MQYQLLWLGQRCLQVLKPPVLMVRLAVAMTRPELVQQQVLFATLAMLVLFAPKWLERLRQLLILHNPFFKLHHLHNYKAKIDYPLQFHPD